MKKFILGIIVGLLISGTIVFAANYLYKADEVSYTPSNTNWEVDNVDSAINELYSMINDANSALLSLKNTDIAKAVGANGDTFSSVINKLGTITDQKNKSFTVNGTSAITIPAGYYNGQGTINVSGLVPTPSGTKTITSNGTNIDVSNFANVTVNVPNTNSGTFTPSQHGTALDMGANNTYRYINTTNVWNQAVAAADARTNTSSANYQAGYNAGLNANNSNTFGNLNILTNSQSGISIAQIYGGSWSGNYLNFSGAYSGLVIQNNSGANKTIVVVSSSSNGQTFQWGYGNQSTTIPSVIQSGANRLGFGSAQTTCGGGYVVPNGTRFYFGLQNMSTSYTIWAIYVI